VELEEELEEMSDDLVGPHVARAGFLVHPAAEMLPMLSDPEID
jgi:hypothetical protein